MSSSRAEIHVPITSGGTTAQFLQQLRTILSLPSNATTDDILARVTTLAAAQKAPQ